MFNHIIRKKGGGVPFLSVWCDTTLSVDRRRGVHVWGALHVG